MHSKKLSSMTLLLLLFFSSLTVITLILTLIFDIILYSHSQFVSMQVAFASASAGENLSTPKSNLIGYWNKEVQNKNAKPTFLPSRLGIGTKRSKTTTPSQPFSHPKRPHWARSTQRDSQNSQPRMLSPLISQRSAPLPTFSATLIQPRVLKNWYSIPTL